MDMDSLLGTPALPSVRRMGDMGTTGVPLAPEHWGELRSLGVWSDPILGGPGGNRAEMNPDMRARAAESHREGNL